MYPGLGNINLDPQLVDADGADDLVGTEDDDLRLSVGSPGADAGNNDAVPADVTDLDGDGNVVESVSVDLDGNRRFGDDPSSPDTGSGPPPIVDLGAYESAEAVEQACCLSLIHI